MTVLDEKRHIGVGASICRGLGVQVHMWVPSALRVRSERAPVFALRRRRRADFEEESHKRNCRAGHCRVVSITDTEMRVFVRAALDGGSYRTIGRRM